MCSILQGAPFLSPEEKFKNGVFRTFNEEVNGNFEKANYIIDGHCMDYYIEGGVLEPAPPSPPPSMKRASRKYRVDVIL